MDWLVLGVVLWFRAARKGWVRFITLRGYLAKMVSMMFFVVVFRVSCFTIVMVNELSWKFDFKQGAMLRG